MPVLIHEKRSEPPLTWSFTVNRPGESPRDKGRSPKEGGGRDTRHLAEGETTRGKSPGYNTNKTLCLPSSYLSSESHCHPTPVPLDSIPCSRIIGSISSLLVFGGDFMSMLHLYYIDYIGLLVNKSASTKQTIENRKCKIH